MGNLGFPELLIIVLLILVFFGSKKIPELAQGLGKGIREFRKATREIDEDEHEEPKKIEDKSQNAEKKG